MRDAESHAALYQERGNRHMRTRAAARSRSSASDPRQNSLRRRVARLRLVYRLVCAKHTLRGHICTMEGRWQLKLQLPKMHEVIPHVLLYASGTEDSRTGLLGGGITVIAVDSISHAAGGCACICAADVP